MFSELQISFWGLKTTTFQFNTFQTSAQESANLFQQLWD